jgi:hypothetical protein
MSSSYSHGLCASVAFQENTLDRLERQHLEDDECDEKEKLQ